MQPIKYALTGSSASLKEIMRKFFRITISIADYEEKFPYNSLRNTVKTLFSVVLRFLLRKNFRITTLQGDYAENWHMTLTAEPPPKKLLNQVRELL
jgi:hypothetical protein